MARGGRSDHRGIFAAPTLRIQEDRRRLIYACDEEALKEVYDEFSNYDQIGLDIEVDLYRGHDLPEGSPRTIQLGAETRNWHKRSAVVDVHQVDSRRIFEILRDPQIEKVIHNAWFEQRWLGYHYGVKIENIFDTMIAARVIETERKSRNPNYTKDEINLAAISQKHLHRELDKTEQAGHWGRKQLTSSQIEYAAYDAEVVLPLARKLKAIAIELGLTDQIKEACQAVTQGVWAEVARKKDDGEQGRVEIGFKLSRSIQELDWIWESARALGMHYSHRNRLEKAYKKRRAELLKG